MSDQAGRGDTATEPPAAPVGIDPRGPRAGAGITAVLLAVVILLWTSPAALVLLAVVAASFLLGAVRGAQGTWQAWVYRVLILPRTHLVRLPYQFLPLDSIVGRSQPAFSRIR